MVAVTGGAVRGDRNQESRIPLVTIITVVFNDENAVEATIQSVIAQSSKEIEYLIIDGGSTDGTVDIVRKYGHAVDYWLSERDEGIYDAFNKGVRLSHGEWILFLGAGDLLFDRESIQNAAAQLKSAGGDVQAAYGRVVRLGADGAFVEEENGPWASMRDKWRGGRQVMPQHQGVFERRTFLIDHVFDVKYKIVADYKSFALAIAVTPPLYLDCVIARVGVGGVSSSPPQESGGGARDHQAQSGTWTGIDPFTSSAVLRSEVGGEDISGHRASHSRCDENHRRLPPVDRASKDVDMNRDGLDVIRAREA
jgi:hypothetical protein